MMAFAYAKQLFDYGDLKPYVKNGEFAMALPIQKLPSLCNYKLHY